MTNKHGLGLPTAKLPKGKTRLSEGACVKDGLAGLGVSAEEMERGFSIPIEVGSCRDAAHRRHWLAASQMFALVIASAIILAGLYGVLRLY